MGEIEVPPARVIGDQEDAVRDCINRLAEAVETLATDGDRVRAEASVDPRLDGATGPAALFGREESGGRSIGMVMTPRSGTEGGRTRELERPCPAKKKGLDAPSHASSPEEPLAEANDPSPEESDKSPGHVRTISWRFLGSGRGLSPRRLDAVPTLDLIGPVDSLGHGDLGRCYRLSFL
jgi:hypothetical protein